MIEVNLETTHNSPRDFYYHHEQLLKRHFFHFFWIYKGNIVPIWLEYVSGKDQIYSALAAAVVGVIFDLNLVEISQVLKEYKSLPEKKS